MPEYTVTWEIDGNGAEGPYEAASMAWDTITGSGSTSTVFVVSDEMGMTTVVDLSLGTDTTPVWVPSPNQVADLAEWMAADQWDISEIVAMVRNPHKYADEYSKFVVEREFDKVAQVPEEEDTEPSSDEERALMK
jgi:hypothetical protein